MAAMVKKLDNNGKHARLQTPITTDLDGWKVVEGSPTMKTWILHTNKDESMISGYWEATPGTYHATYASFEFVHLLEGKLVITPDGGDAVTYCICIVYIAVRQKNEIFFALSLRCYGTTQGGHGISLSGPQTSRTLAAHPPPPRAPHAGREKFFLFDLAI